VPRIAAALFDLVVITEDCYVIFRRSGARLLRSAYGGGKYVFKEYIVRCGMRARFGILFRRGKRDRHNIE
jgi:hypothetical protein